MLRLLKFVALAALAFFAAVALFFAFAVFTAAGRGQTICRMYADVQRENKDVPLGRAFPASGRPGAPDAAPPPAGTQWLPVGPQHALPLPAGEWTLKEHGTSMGVARGDDSVRVEQDSVSSDAALFNEIGDFLFGRPKPFGELVHDAFAMDLTKPCDPAKPARDLLLEMFLMSMKEVQGRGALLEGVLDQAPLATTMLVRMENGRLGIDTVLPGGGGKWWHISYDLGDEAEARAMVRALRGVGHGIGDKARAKVSDWDESLPAALGFD